MNNEQAACDVHPAFGELSRKENNIRGKRRGIFREGEFSGGEMSGQEFSKRGKCPEGNVRDSFGRIFCFFTRKCTGNIRRELSGMGVRISLQHYKTQPAIGLTYRHTHTCRQTDNFWPVYILWDQRANVISSAGVLTELRGTTWPRGSTCSWRHAGVLHGTTDSNLQPIPGCIDIGHRVKSFRWVQQLPLQRYGTWLKIRFSFNPLSTSCFLFVEFWV